MIPETMVQRAHDLLVAKLIDRFGRQLETDEETIVALQVDVLCWILEHNHNRSFASNLELLRHDLADAGMIEVKYDQPFVGRPPEEATRQPVVTPMLSDGVVVELINLARAVTRTLGPIRHYPVLMEQAGIYAKQHEAICACYDQAARALRMNESHLTFLPSP